MLIAGDLLEIGPAWAASQRTFAREELPRILAELRTALPTGQIIAQMGNDDLHTLEPELRAFESQGLFHLLNNEVREIEGLWFGGMNRVRDYPFRYKHWVARDGDVVDHPVQYRAWTESGLAAFRRRLLMEPSIGESLEFLAHGIPEKERLGSVWLIHQPPSETGLGNLESGQDVGSPDVLDFLDRHQPILSCHGHIHESPEAPGGRWAMAVADTLALQPGQLGSRLHYVMCQVAPGAVTDVRHSIYGRLPLEMNRPGTPPDRSV